MDLTDIWIHMFTHLSNPDPNYLFLSYFVYCISVLQKACFKSLSPIIEIRMCLLLFRTIFRCIYFLFIFVCSPSKQFSFSQSWCIQHDSTEVGLRRFTEICNESTAFSLGNSAGVVLETKFRRECCNIPLLSWFFSD